MNDIEKLPSIVKNIYKNFPQELSLSYDMIETATITIPDRLFDDKVPLQTAGQFGLFVPLLVLQNGDTQYTVIDGCKRFLTCKKQRRDVISCQVIRTPLDNIAAGLLRILVNQGRPVELRETFMFFTWLKDNFSDNAFLQVVNNLGLNGKRIRQCTSLSSTQKSVQEAFLEKTLDISLIDNFQILSKKDQIKFLETFQDFSLSFQIQREFLEWLPEIAYTKNVSIEEILDHATVQNVLNSTTLNKPQKVQKIRSLLYIQKFPRLSEAEKKWKEASSRVNPDPSCVSFEHNPFFEKNRLDIKITVSSETKAVDILDRLAHISPETWKKLIYPL